MTPECRKALQLRLAYAQSATKKFHAIDRLQHNGRVYETLQAWGASRTGRWGGRGLQVQNLKRPTRGVGDPDRAAQTLAEDPDLFARLYTLEDLGSLVRSAIRAPDDYSLVVSDLSSIEPRVLGWLTGCVWINEVFARGKDTYKAFAEMWLRAPYDDVDKPTRDLCKGPFLGFGYGIGAGGLKTYAEGMGVEMSEDQCESAIKTVRKVCYEVPRFWMQIEGCFRLTAQTGVPTGDGLGLPIQMEGRFLTIRLPSGRKLYYDAPEDDPEEGLSYMGQNQYTNKWERIRTYGARLTENLCQAIARDVLVEGLYRYAGIGGTLITHIHDEAVAVEIEWAAEDRLAEMNRCLSEPVPWAPGLLLGSSGYISKRYRKD